MAIKDKNGAWVDARGKAVPSKYVSVIDRKRDALVERNIKRLQALRDRMAAVKAQVDEDIDKYMDFVAKETDVKPSGKGNLILTGFSGDKQLEVAMSDVLEFDERLNFAKGAIDGCLRRWGENANQNLQVIIEHAFQMDKKGRLDKHAILKLRQINIRDKEWKKAMALLADALKVTGTRRYLNARVRTNPDDRFRTIGLNFSSI